MQELAALRKARREEREGERSLYKGRLFPPGPPAADPRINWAADVQQPWVVRLWAYLRSLLQLLFPPAIWQRHAETRTDAPS